MLPCPVIKANGRLQQSNPGRMTKSTDPSESKPAEALAAGGGNVKWVVEKGGYKHQLRPCDQLQK